MYLWLKAFHIIFIISWMASLLYLPRLFVYHAQSSIGSQQSETFKLMERRLLYYIMNPSMIISLVLGLWLIVFTDALAFGWMHAKLFLVLLLLIYHHMLLFWYKAFEKDQNRHTARFFKYMNEVPTLIMICIVLLVVLKPF